MRPAFSIVTAIRPGGDPELLAAAYRSLCRQRLDSWQWLVQQDGDQAALPDAFLEDARVSPGANGRNFGSAVTRNMALARAQGDWILPLDDDDLLVPQTLERLHDALAEHPRARAAMFAAWVLKGGRIYRRDPALVRLGELEPGEFTQIYLERGGHTGVHAAAACFDHRCLLELGGWPATMAGEDAQLLSAFTLRWPALHLEDTLLVWRHYAEQTHKAAWYEQSRGAARQLTARRLAAMGATASDPRSASMKQRAASTQMQLTELTLAELGIDAGPAGR